MNVYVKGVDPSLGIVLGVCGHWWQAATIAFVVAMDCPTCGRPPGVFIHCWDEAWPDPKPDACPITGQQECRSRRCELHYMDAPLDMATETNPHPDVPDGPWKRFGDCPECGTHRGFGCVDVAFGSPPGRRLGYAHAGRPLDA